MRSIVRADRNACRPSCAAAQICWLDAVAIALTIACGLAFLWDARAWVPYAYVGHDQYGDAGFWWQGALQLSRGIFWDNANFGHRMGYAIFGGLIDAVIGPSYPVFHKILLLIYLGLASCAYLVAIPAVGRPVAFVLAATLVFLPYPAEWLAASTSDSLGLAWNLSALLALVLALRRGRLLWATLAGLFLALGGLTRPLMVPYMAVAALLLILCLRGRGRPMALAAFAAAFAAPTALWMALFYVKTGSLGIAGHDASVLFAASTPKYQVWTPGMVEPVRAAARARLGVTKISRPQLNEEFRRETLLNYRADYAYHLARVPGHLMALAGFSPQQFHPADRIEPAVRLLLRALAAAAILGAAVPRRAFMGGAAAVAVCILSLWPPTAAAVVLASAVVGLLPLTAGRAEWIYRVIASYWWTAIVALYFVGGTWGPPLTPVIAIDALGYRLGTQFFFANEWLPVLLMLAVAGVFRPQPLTIAAGALPAWIGPSLGARRTIVTAGLAGVVLLGTLLASGAAVVGRRAWNLSHAPSIPMPPTDPVVAALCGGTEPRVLNALPAQSHRVLRSMARPSEPDGRREGLHLFTGALGSLIWQIEEQRRTTALFHQQDVRFQFRAHAAPLQVEFAGLVEEARWRDREGAFLMRSFREDGPHRMPYSEALPKVQLFVPLAADLRSFDVAQAARFPLARYAAALAHAGRMKVTGGRLEWWTYPTADYKPRWFNIVPQAGAEDERSSGLEVDLSDAIGSRSFDLSFRVEPLPGNLSAAESLNLAVDAIDAAGNLRPVIRRQSRARGNPDAVEPDRVHIEVPPDAARLSVIVAHLKQNEMLRVIELQLVSDDVVPSVSASVCKAP